MKLSPQKTRNVMIIMLPILWSGDVKFCVLSAIGYQPDINDSMLKL
ncbi:hypothetical protein [Anabaena sp. WFMT]